MLPSAQLVSFSSFIALTTNTTVIVAMVLELLSRLQDKELSMQCSAPRYSDVHHDTMSLSLVSVPAGDLARKLCCVCWDGMGRGSGCC